MSLAGSHGAACALHPTVSAVATCSRCGNYMCEGCRAVGRADVCDACAAIIGAFPMSRDRYDVSQALSYAWSRYKVEWVIPTMLSLVFLGLNVGFVFIASAVSVQFASPDSIAPGMIAAHSVQLVGAVLQGVLVAGLFRVAVVALQGQTPTVQHVAQGMSHSGTLVMLQVIGFFVGSAVGVPFGVARETGAITANDLGLLCTIIGAAVVVLPVAIYVSLGIQNAGIETMIDPDVGLVDALKRSWAVAKGARGDLFIAGLVGGLVMLGGAIACCVGVIPAAGVAMYLTTATHLALRHGMVPPAARKFDS